MQESLCSLQNQCMEQRWHSQLMLITHTGACTPDNTEDCYRETLHQPAFTTGTEYCVKNNDDFSLDLRTTS